MAEELTKVIFDNLIEVPINLMIVGAEGRSFHVLVKLNGDITFH